MGILRKILSRLNKRVYGVTVESLQSRADVLTQEVASLNNEVGQLRFAYNTYHKLYEHIEPFTKLKIVEFVKGDFIPTKTYFVVTQKGYYGLSGFRLMTKQYNEATRIAVHKGFVVEDKTSADILYKALRALVGR